LNSNKNSIADGRGRPSCDRIIRDGEHLIRAIHYIGRNPEKSKLPQDRWYRWIAPDWQDAGWDFERDIS
jgi:hypothetical protein